MRPRARTYATLALLVASGAVLAVPASGGGVAGPTALVGNGGIVWVADTSGTVRRLDARTGRLVASTRVLGYPESLAVDDESVWVATVQPGVIVRISRRTNRPAGTPIDIGAGDPIRLADAAATLWAVNAVDDRVWRVRTRRGTVEGSTVVAAHPWTSATVTADATGAWVAYAPAARASVLVRLDASGRIVARRAVPGLEIDALAITGRTLLALGGPAGALLRLDAASGAPQAPAIRVGRSPTGLAVTGDRVWVSSLGPAGSVREIDVRSGRTVVGPRRAPGRAGRADSIALAGGVLWAINAYGIVSRLDLRTGARRGRSLRAP